MDFHDIFAIMEYVKLKPIPVDTGDAVVLGMLSDNPARDIVSMLGGGENFDDFREIGLLLLNSVQLSAELDRWDRWTVSFLNIPWEHPTIPAMKNAEYAEYLIKRWKQLKAQGVNAQTSKEDYLEYAEMEMALTRLRYVETEDGEDWRPLDPAST